MVNTGTTLIWSDQMEVKDIIAAIQNGDCDFELDAISRAIVSREIVWKREIEADSLSERRAAMREAVHEQRLEQQAEWRNVPLTRDVCSNGGLNAQPGDVVRIKATSRLRPRYLIGVELVFVRARVSNAEVRYRVPDDSKYGKLSLFLCPMKELEFVRKG